MARPTPLPWLSDPLAYFIDLPGVQTSCATLPWLPDEWMRHGWVPVPITQGRLHEYQAYARALDYTEDTINADDPEEWPLGRLIELNHHGMLQYCLLTCKPFQTEDPTHINDVRQAMRFRLSTVTTARR